MVNINSLDVSYHSILKRHRIAWSLEENQNVDVYHFPSDIKHSLESDLYLTQYGLRKGFKGFMKHTIKLSEAFKLVDNDKTRPGNSDGNSKRSGNDSKSKSNDK